MAGAVLRDLEALPGAAIARMAHSLDELGST